LANVNKHPYLSSNRIGGDVYSTEYELPMPPRLAPSEYTYQIGLVIDSLLDHLLTMANEKEIRGRVAKLQKAMAILRHFFYDETDGPSGRVGWVTPSKLMTSLKQQSLGAWWNQTLSDNQRSAFMMFAVQVGGLKPTDPLSGKVT